MEASLSLAGSVRDLPAAPRDLTEVKVARPTGAAIAFAAACTLPLWMGQGELIRASALVALAVVGCSIVVLTGWSGQVSLGQMSFAAVGGVMGAVALIDWHWDLSLAFLLAGATAAVVAVVVGLPTLRLDGMFAAVTTLAFALAASGYLLVPAEFSWIPQGQLGTPYLFGVSITSQASTFELSLGVLVLVLVAIQGLRHSRVGRVLRALPANQRAASGYGVRIVWAKLTAFAISGFIAGLAGVPAPPGHPVVSGDVVPGVGQPRRLHLHRRRRALVVPRRRPRRGHRRGQRRLPAAELAALPRRTRRDHRAHPLPPRAGRPLLRPARLGGRRARQRRHGAAHARHPGGRAVSPGRGRLGNIRQLGGGASLFPLGVLFAIQLLDQATQSAFNVLTPNIRDAFHLTNAGILLIVAIAGAAGARVHAARSPCSPTARTGCASR